MNKLTTQRSGLSKEEVEELCKERLKTGVSIGLVGGTLAGVSGFVAVLALLFSKGLK